MLSSDPDREAALADALAAVLPDALADDALHADGIDDDGAGTDEVLVCLEPCDAGRGVAGQDDELAGGDGVGIELSIHRLDHGKLERRVRAVPGVDLGATGMERLGKGASDEAKAHDADAPGHEGGRMHALFGRHARPPRP